MYRRKKFSSDSARSVAGREQQTRNKFTTAAMAKSKAVTRSQTTIIEAPVTTAVANGTPYQLDSTQVDRAAKALVSHMKKHIEEKDEKAAVKNLADDEDEAEDNDQPIFLSLTTKKQFNETTSLKPTKMSVQTSACRIKHC
jgi:ribosome biogenesis protein UTP30